MKGRIVHIQLILLFPIARQQFLINACTFVILNEHPRELEMRDMAKIMFLKY